MFQAIRTAEKQAKSNSEMAAVVAELRSVVGLTGSDITTALEGLIKKGNSAIKKLLNGYDGYTDSVR